MTLIKKYWFLVVLSFLATILLILKVLLKVTPPFLPAPAENFWIQIVPEKTEKSQVEKILGKPLEEEKQDNQSIYYYQSQVQNWPTKVYFSEKDNKVKLIKRYFPSSQETYQSFINQLGPPDKKFYGPHEGAGFSVFAFFRKGVALVANPDSDLVLEVWYFSPTTEENFLSIVQEEVSSSPSIRF